MKKSILLSAILLTFVFGACSNDSDDDMTPPPTPPTNNVTYTNSVKAIIDSNCLNCHGTPPTNNAPMSLTSFDDVKNSVQSRGLIGRVENGTMPPSGNLSTSQIQAIKDWQTGGYLQ